MSDAHTVSANEQSRLAHRTIHRIPSGRIDREQADLPPANASAIASELRKVIEGEVRFDDGARALYATDSSNYRQVPIGVVLPKTREDVIRTVEVCRRFDVPVLPRGGGTSLAGECCNTAVVIDFSKYLNRVLEIDPKRRIARVEPGCILDHLRKEAGKHGLTFGPDPATHDHNTLGGMIGNDSGGVHTLMNGITVFNVEALEVLTYDGLMLRVGPTDDQELRSIRLAGGRRAEIYRKLESLRDRYGEQIRERFPHIPRRVSGYENLDQLFHEKGFNVARALVGTEATCVTILEATVTLIPAKPERVLAMLGFPDIFLAADAVPEVLKYKPIALEGFDQIMVDRYKVKGLHAEDLKILPKGHGWLLVEFGADKAKDAEAMGRRFVKAFKSRRGVEAKLVADKADQTRFWALRDDSLGAESYVPNHPDTWPGWEDSAVAPENLGAYLRDMRALFKRYGYDPVTYGHFGDGILHCAIAFDLYDEPGIEKWRQFLNEAADCVVRHGGSLSGEHGDGQARGALLEKMYGPELVQAFREFKAIWDPAWRMNPGKVIDPFPITSNLRVGPDYKPPELKTHFAYANDKGSFARAAQRCVGTGKCRRHDSGHEVMCPSFLVTHEEQYTTRGRARLLFEMLHGGAIDKGWRSDAVEEALRLCLACKGCKHDCPVNVDMATYKAEFRSHYYAGRLRPRHAYSMGLIHRWARLASAAPALANVFTQTAGLSGVAKWMGGIAQQRTIPPFARRTYRSWYQNHRPGADNGNRVLLWPDTFNNYFRPETAIAATRALEAAGFTVIIPDKVLCCGRPLYDWGMLDTAKSLLRRTINTLRAELEQGTPVIGLEPACLATFKDELPNLFPGDGLAKRLESQSVFFSDFMAGQADRLQGLGLQTNGQRPHVIVQTHCHHHAVIGAGGEQRLIENLGLDVEYLASGCCGMAGSFGFAAGTYDVAMAAGERVLLPAIRAASPESFILADGYSCREQIEQATKRRTWHMADLLAHGLDGDARYLT
jgi:FAD/FMN-containing dehydrogenase/Fe-S oxidoreductase